GVVERGKGIQVIFRDGEHVLGKPQVFFFLSLHASPFPPGKRSPQRIPCHLVMALPNHSFHVVSEQELGRGMIPRNDASSGEKIAQNHVVTLLLQKATEFVADLPPAVLGDTVWLTGQDAAKIIAELAETPGRRQSQGDKDDVVEDTLEFRVNVI